MWWQPQLYETIKCGLGRNKGRRRADAQLHREVYCRILNEKKTTIVKAERTKNRRTPFVQHPKEGQTQETLQLTDRGRLNSTGRAQGKENMW
jgi:hypothetical protein